MLTLFVTFFVTLKALIPPGVTETKRVDAVAYARGVIEPPILSANNFYQQHVFLVFHRYHLF